MYSSLYLGGNDDKLINDFLLNIWLGGWGGVVGSDYVRF